VAKETGLLMIEEPEALTGSISYSLLEHDVPALTLELGESYVVNEQDVDCGVKAVVNILAWLGMLDNPDGPSAFDVPDSLRGKILRLSSEPVSPTSGITRFMANPHDMVKKGQVVAEIYNAFGKLQDTIVALDDGIVLGHSDSSVAFPGAPIMAFGTSSGKSAPTGP
jgi:predicted deacylase